jgi:hypothetical protein
MKCRYGFLTLCSFAGCCLVGLGCGGGAIGPSVKGKVLLDGQPVADARVEFQGKGGRQAVTDKDGAFELDGKSPYKTVSPGTYKVTITKYVDAKGESIPPDQYEMVKMSGNVKHALPARYADPFKTDQSAEIKAGKNDLNPFELKSK